MVKTRSRDGDSKGKELDVEDPMESRLSRLEDMFAERNKMMKQFADMVKALAGQQLEELQSSDVFWEEKSVSQFQVPIANSESLKSIEPGEVDLGLENLVTVVMDENLEQEWVHKRFESVDVDGEVERDQKMLSMEKVCCAHKVFAKMSQHKKRQRKTPKYHKTWKFRFKNMDLQRVMTQLDTRHFIFRWDSECILHLSTVVHHLETSHKQSSFTIDALQSDFDVESWMFTYKRGKEKHHTLTFSKNMRMVKTSSDLLLLNGKDNPPQTATCFELDVGGTDSLNQDRHKLCAENEGCLDCSQALVLMNGITNSSSRAEEWMKEEPDFVEVNEVKMEKQIVDREMSQLIAVLETVTKRMIGSHVMIAFVFKETAISYYQCIEHNLFSTMLLRLQSKKKQRKGHKSWMFKYKFDEEDQGLLQSRTGWTQEEPDVIHFLLRRTGWTQEEPDVIHFLLRRHLHLYFDCEEPELAGRKRNHGVLIRLHSKQKQRKCSKCWMFKFRKKKIDHWLGYNLIVTVFLWTNHKLSPKYFGPCKIIDKCGEVAYKLQLPETSQIHPIFHVSQLKVLVGNVHTSTHLPTSIQDNMIKEPELILERKWSNIKDKLLQRFWLSGQMNRLKKLLGSSLQTCRSVFQPLNLEDKVLEEGRFDTE